MAALAQDWLPASLDLAPAIVLIVASFFTSAITAAFGVGGGLALLALMGLFVPVSALIPVHGVVQLGSNSGRAWHLRSHASISVLMPFMLGGVAGAIVGGAVVVELPDGLLRATLGLFVLASIWVRVPAAPKVSPALLLAGGAATTALTMFVGATGPLVNALFSRALDQRQALIASAAIAMAVQHALKVVVFALFGFAFAQWLPLIVAMIATGYAGTVAGARLLDAMPERTFRIAFKAALTLLALDLIRRGLFG